MPRSDPLAAGALWALAVFAAGALLGTVRTLWLAPLAGPTLAVLIELPVILALSWLLARAVLALRPVAAVPRSRLAMGAAFLAVLLALEAALAAALGQGPGAWAAGLATPPGALGLAAQVAAALIPRALIGR